MTELQHAQSPPQVLPSSDWSRTSLALPDQMTFDEWLQVGEQLHAMDRSVLWWLGDWLIYGEQTYAQRFSKALELTGYSRERLREAQKVAAAFPPPERSARISWDHHKVAASLPRERRVEAIRTAEAQGWEVRDLRAEVARIAAGAKEPEPQPNVLPAAVTDRTLRRTGKVVQAAFSEWFGVGDEYARVILALYQTGGKPMDWRDIARFVSSHHPMSRGAVHEAIHVLRTVFEAEAIDRDDDGYWLTEIGFAECRRAFRDLGEQLIGLGAEAANEP